MNDFDYQGIPYFKIKQDLPFEYFAVEWVLFCLVNNYDMRTNKPKLG